MPTSHQDLSVPLQVDFVQIDDARVNGSGVLTSSPSGECRLDTELQFPVLQTRTENTSVKWLSGRGNAVDFAIGGRVAWSGGRQHFEVTEMHWGTSSPDIPYKSVVARYENLSILNSYRFEDGAARDATELLSLPALDGSPEMSAAVGAHSDLIRISAATPERLEAFETHLRSFQDLITLAADLPSARISLAARTDDDREVEIIGRSLPSAQQPPLNNPVDALIRFGSSQLQEMISEWWRVRRALRPITQVYAGVMYQPGYVESDIISLTSIAQRLARLQLGQADANLRTCLQTLVGNLGDETMRRAGIDPIEWEQHTMWARNDISHEGAPNDEAGERYVTPAESKAVRDATHMIVGLNLASMLGLHPNATRLAAQCLETKYGIRHGSTSIFAAPH